jgi:hypothetical protein
VNITLYFIHWRDPIYLPFIKAHYGKFCNKIVMYDNYSNDWSVGLGEQLGFEVRNFGWNGQLNDQAYLDVKNHCWKEERGKNVDYVIVVDADEFIVPLTLAGTVPIVQGFDMISNQTPVQSIFEINTGEPSVNYSKRAIFNPDAIEEIAYDHGCHTNRMRGIINESGTCKLYHFRKICGVDVLIDRHQKQYAPRMSKINLKYKWGGHYMHDADQKRKDWDEHMARAVTLGPRGQVLQWI